MIGLVGCGRWGTKILRDLVALGCEVGVVARSEPSVDRALSGGASTVWRSVDEIDGVAGIVVATPASTHADVVDQVLELGVPVFTEKPLATDPDSARSLVERAPERLFVMHKWRHHRGVQAMRDLVDAGDHGRLRAVAVRFTSLKRQHPDVDGTWVLLPHTISILLEITGSVPDLKYAKGWIRPQTGEADALVGLGEGGRLVNEVSTMRPRYERSVIAHFEDLTVILADGYDAHLTYHDLTGSDGPAEVPFEASMPLYDELAAFVDHVSGGPPPRSSASEALAVVTLISAIRKELEVIDP